MGWLEILKQIFEVCIVPLLGLLTTYLIIYIRSKSKEITDASENALVDKYVNLLSETISSCVLATNQTYVENLKKENLFDAEAQKEAFNKTFNAVMSILTDNAKVYLKEIYGDLDTFIKQKIEAEVNVNK